MASSLPQHKRQLESEGDRQFATEHEERIQRHNQDQTFSGISIDGRVRAHLGHHYGDVHHHNYSRTCFDEPEDKATVLIKWLQFPRQTARRDQIERAHRKTFNWIFEEQRHDEESCRSGSDDRTLHRGYENGSNRNGKANSNADNEQAQRSDANEDPGSSDDGEEYGSEDEDHQSDWRECSHDRVNVRAVGFAPWLRAGHGLYWIKGKAGSGKSTLMRMISEDDRTHQLLREWASGDSYIFSSFYFWNTGTDMQKSTLGLLRSVLCDVLKKQPAIAEATFPDFQPRFTGLEPTVEQVKVAFERAMKLVDTNVCLLIDGLDEFEGTSVHKSELSKLILKVAEAPHVKVIVSSRPLQVFESNFHGQSSLAIHDLTKNDIRTMVSTTLKNATEVAQTLVDDPEGLEDLVDGIAWRSDGVFLWAVWAVKVILDGSCHGDRVAELCNRLDELPTELEKMFEMMLNRVEPRCKRDCSRYLQIALFWDENVWYRLSTTVLGLAADFERVSKDFWKESLPEDYLASYLARTRARLQAATQGLLEERDEKIEFMHRSVKDFLASGVFTSVCIRTSSDISVSGFDPTLASSMACAMATRLAAGKQNKVFRGSVSWFMTEFFACSGRRELESGLPQTEVADRLYEYVKMDLEDDGRESGEELGRLRFLFEAMSGNCWLYTEEKFGEEGSILLSGHPGLLFGVILLGPESVTMLGGREQVVATLLNVGADPYHRECLNENFHNTRDRSLRFDQPARGGSFYPWEVALLHILATLNLSGYPGSILSLLNTFELLLEHTKSVNGASEVPTRRAHARTAYINVNLEALGGLKAVSTLKLVLDKDCDGCYWRYGECGTFSSCPCEYAAAYRQKICIILEKLDQRTKEHAQQRLAVAQPEEHAQSRRSEKDDTNSSSDSLASPSDQCESSSPLRAVPRAMESLASVGSVASTRAETLNYPARTLLPLLDPARQQWSASLPLLTSVGLGKRSLSPANYDDGPIR